MNVSMHKFVKATHGIGGTSQWLCITDKDGNEFTLFVKEPRNAETLSRIINAVLQGESEDV